MDNVDINLCAFPTLSINLDFIMSKLVSRVRSNFANDRMSCRNFNEHKILRISWHVRIILPRIKIAHQGIKKKVNNGKWIINNLMETDRDNQNNDWILHGTAEWWHERRSFSPQIWIEEPSQISQLSPLYPATLNLALSREKREKMQTSCTRERRCAIEIIKREERGREYVVRGERTCSKESEANAKAAARYN